MCRPVSQNCDFKSFPALIILIMTILESLLSRDAWLRFYDYKVSGGHMTKREENELKEYITNGDYLPAAQRIYSGVFFSIPQAVQINKSFSDKKRTVFMFSEDENILQKFLAYQLQQYDALFSPNLYSFRINKGVKCAERDVFYQPDISRCYSFKLDISDYFNSVDTALLLPRLKEIFEPDFYRLIAEMLTNPYAYIDGEQKEIKKGILAGSPLSGFLANLYLSDLDKYFYDNGILYARYSDDIIVFAESEEDIKAYEQYIYRFLDELKLRVNYKKVAYTLPGEQWSFLGFSYENGVIDIAEASKQKLKKKLRRKARALYRWKIKKGAEDMRAVKAFIRYFNQKLYENPVNNEITWCRWYFPVINTDTSLKELDAYMQQCIRYIATGKQNKGMYRFSYENMTNAGYRTLVNSYYRFRQNNFKKSVDN